jgi:hypothetical protein
MKRLAFLSFAIGTLLAPITVQAQTAVQAQMCVTFLAPNHEAEVRYLISHPGVLICPTARGGIFPGAYLLPPPDWDAGLSARFGQWLTNSTTRTIDLMRAMNGGR